MEMVCTELSGMLLCVCWFVLVLQGSLLRGMSLKIKRKMKSAATMLELAGMS
jgi:hypothetical protein